MFFAGAARILRLYSIYPAGALEDINYILREYSNFSINMGYSDSTQNTNFNTNLPSFRPLLVFAGNEYLLDKGALSDLKESGSELPPNFLNNFRNCKGRAWLFPRGGKPFENVTGYGKLLFGENFYKAFYDNYEFKESGVYYDIWVCKNAHPISQ